MQPLQNRANQYIKELADWHDAQNKVIAHGEVYPPHIFVDGTGVTLIDWENFNLVNPVSDFMQVWVRAFDDLKWREEFRQYIYANQIMPKDVFDRLWNIEKLYQSGRNLNYLFYSSIESDAQKAAASASFVKNIEEALGDR